LTPDYSEEEEEMTSTSEASASGRMATVTQINSQVKRVGIHSISYMLSVKNIWQKGSGLS
jgi:hypothetical protein